MGASRALSLATRPARQASITASRQTANGQWRKIAQFATCTGSKKAFPPIGFGSDGTLYVRAHAGRDTSALHRFDLAAGKLDPEPVVVTRGYDFTGSLVSQRGKLLGVSIETDAASNVWFDKEMQAVRQKVDKLLPATANLISPASRPDSPRALGSLYSDVQPLAYYLYNLKTERSAWSAGAAKASIRAAWPGRIRCATRRATGARFPPC